MSQAVPFMNHSVKQLSAVRMRVFFYAFLWHHVVLFCDPTDLLKWLMWRSNGFAPNSASNSARQLWKHTKCLKKHLMIMPWAKRIPTNGLSISRTGGCQSMMKSILDDLWPEPWTKTWQKFDTEDIVHKDRWWMENSLAVFWGNWGKAYGKNIQTSGATTHGPWMTMLQLMRRSLCGSFWFLRIWQSSPTLPTNLTSPPAIFSYSRRWNWNSRGDVLTALRWSKPNCRTWRSCCETTSRSTSDCGNPAGITVSMQRGLLWRGWGD